jgi:outer membrane protein OmpA-like peptidoglycan-associated protein
MNQTLVELSNQRDVASPEQLRTYRRLAMRLAPSEDAYVIVERIAEPYIRARQWEKAIEVYEEYRPRFTSRDSTFAFRFDAVAELLAADEEELEVRNLGSDVNSKAHELLPVLSADGRYLYFTGRQRYGRLANEDVFFSVYQRGRWSKARNMEKINTTQNESPSSISADGNRLIVLGNYQGSFGRGDIFFVDHTREGWGAVQHLPRPVNSIYYEDDGFVTADGKAMLFTSDRPGNVGKFAAKDEPYHGNTAGNTDIYVALRTSQGWSEPINLGPSINTPYAERTPFLHPDGKTLYFSSDGHYGLGRMDVLKSTRLSDTSWVEWSEPRNLGKEINTAGNDFGYTVATSGDVACFSSYGIEGEKSFGGYDIYSITLPGAARPEAVATVSGKVTDKYGNPIDAAIKWEDLVTGENVGELRSNPRDGSYFIVLPLGRNYGYYAEKEGYYPRSNNVDLTADPLTLDITEDIVMISIIEIKEQGTPVRINNIFFDFDKSELRPESYPELGRLSELLKSNPGMRVEISGHTDDVGSPEYNLDLSRQRAQSVVSHLISIGCQSANLVPKGYGEARPVDTNQTEQGRAQNRRVEFKFLK